MIFLTLLIAAIGLVGLSWLGSNRILHPIRRLEAYTPEQFGLPIEEVSFRSADDTPLAGWFVPGEGQAAILLLHGYGRSRAELLPHAAFLHRAGYSVLLFDFRHRGLSGGNAVTLGAKEPLDVFGAVHYLRGRAEIDPGRIGVLGISLGGAVGIIAAAVSPDIKAVIAEGAFHNLRSVVEAGMKIFIGLPNFPFASITRIITERRLGVSIDEIVPEEVISQVSPRPVLLIHGLADQLISYEAAQILYRRAEEPKSLWLVPDATHGVAYYKEAEEYKRRVLDFLERHL